MTLFSLLLGLTVAQASAGTVLDRVAAVVNDEVIALTEVYELGGPFIEERCGALKTGACVNDMELQVLDELVKRVLIRHELAQLDMMVSGAEVDMAIDSVVRDNEFPDRQALRAEVERSGMRWDAYREQLLESLRVQRFQQVVLAPRVSVSDDELRDVYQRTVRDVAAEKVVQLDAFGQVMPAELGEADRAALIETLAVAVTALNDKTLSWDEAVATYDKAGLASAIGGKTYKSGELAEPVDAVVWTAPEGVVQEPVVVGDVIFVIRVNDFQEIRQDVVPFEKAVDNLRNALFQDKLAEAETEWYQRARRQAAVDILIEP